MCFVSSYLPAAVNAANAEDKYEKVEIWTRTDIILKSDKDYADPYKDVTIDAVFTHEDGTEIALYGFWNGSDEWRVRFSPTKTGVWSYKVTCSDDENTGLHGKTGKLLAVENTGNTELDRHGFVRISDNGRYFVYDDGTPFYWLGDTNWQAPNYVSITQCNYPGCSCGNQFMHEVNDRIAKGFTVYQTYFDSGESDGGGQRATTTEPSMWLDKYGSIDPKTFTEKFDVMFDYLAARGMVIALGFGVHSNTTNAMGKENLDRISRYLTARYASYPVVWITAQEITGAPQYDLWVSSAKIVDAGDGYDHPQGAHQFVVDVNNSYVKDLDEKQSWHEFYALQGGHGPTFTSKNHYEGYWNNTRSGSVKPYIETEANYEDIICGGFNGYDASRIAAWKANLSGSYGFTYGATGVWANNYSTAGNTGWLGSFSYEPWYMGLDKPGSFEMTYLASFFKYVDFSSLVPRFNNTGYSNLTDETKLVASSEDGNTYVAYFFNATTTTGELRGLNADEKYSAKWYNPLTGKFVEISDDITVTDGVYTIPQKPTTGDWALLVTSRTDLGDYGTENTYTDALIDTRVNYALEATATASSYNGNEYAPSKAIDGSLSTYWCASNGNMPQWFRLDMKEARSFAEINLMMHPGNSTITENATITVEGSDDGTNYTLIERIVRQTPEKYKGKDLFRITASGTYRYLKITFEEINTNWATLYEISVYDAPSVQETAEPVNILAGAIASASSESGYTNDAGKANDGNGSSYWCASSGNLPQWVSFDMGEVRSFNRFSFSMVGSNTANVNYVIEGSNDGNSWTEFYSELVAAPEKSGNSVLFTGTTDSMCECRYLRIRFNSLDNNWATIYEIEAYNAPAVQGHSEPDNILTGAIGSASSDTGAVNDANKAVDGSGSTWWCASSGNLPQWVSFDMGEVRSFNRFSFTMYGGTTNVSYVIEGSDDGETWTTFYAENNVTPGAAGNSALITGSTENVCSCRYLRVTLNGLENNWATIVELEAYLVTGDDILPEYEGNLQTPGVFCSGSHIYTANGNGSNTTDALFDGDTSTVWAPYGPIGSQTILMDLYESKELYGINIILGNNAIVPDYRIEGSTDGENWVILVDATLRDAQVYNTQDQKVVSEALSGSYRYIKLLWLNAGSNSDIKTIAEIALYADGETPEAPEFPDLSSLIELYKDSAAISNSDKTYTGTSYRSLILAIGNACEVIANRSATAADVEYAESTLNSAIRGLTEFSVPQDIEDTTGEPGTEVTETGDAAVYIAIAAAIVGIAAIAGVIGIKQRKKFTAR